MTNAYLSTLRADIRGRLQVIADGSGDIEDVVEQLVDEVEHAYARGHLVALAHLREETLQTPQR